MGQAIGGSLPLAVGIALSLYRFRTRRTGFELRFGVARELRHDRLPCLSVCCT